MIDGGTLRGWLGDAAATMRRGLGARGEDLLVAALVAAPFAGTFGIWLAWATWWPNPVIWVLTAVAEAAGAAYAAGRMRDGAAETTE